MVELEVSHEVEAVDQVSEILPDLRSAGVEMGPIGIASPGELKKEPELEFDFSQKYEKGKLEYNTYLIVNRRNIAGTTRIPRICII